MTQRLRDFFQFWVALCVFTGLFLFAFGYAAHSFPASTTAQNEIGNGTYLVQSEGEAPEICHSVAKTVKQLIEVDSGVEVFLMTNRTGERRLVAYLSDGTAILMPIESSEIICSGGVLDQMQTLMFQTITQDPESKIETVPVWPQQEE